MSHKRSLCLILLLVACWTGGAWGKAVVVESDPVNGAVLAHAPGEITLHFDAKIRPRLTRLSLYDVRGLGLPLPSQRKGSATTDRLTVVLPLLGRGSYVLHYKVVSTDGHTTFGTVSFTPGGY